MRCFIAIELDDRTRKYLCEVQSNLRKIGVNGNYSRPENIHLTVKFLGELDMTGYNYVCKAVKKVAQTQKQYVLTLDKIGKFDKGSKSIIWAGLEQNESLIETFRRVEKEIEDFMPGMGEKQYSPHITLVREAVFVKSSLNTITFGSSAERFFPASGLSVMESTRENGHLVYIRRDFAPLA